MNLEEFRIRFDELRRMRKLVKAVPLSDRLTELVEAYLEAAVEEAKRMRMDALRASVELSRIQATPREAPVGDDHFFVAPGVETRALLAEAAAEIAAHNEAVPAEDTYEVKPPTGPSDSTRNGDQEPKKPCKDCGDPKPLSEFPKNPSYKDGRTNKCNPCTRVYRQGKKRAERKAPEQKPQNVTQLPQPEEPGPEDRLCSSGERCVKADPDDLVPTPAILDAANDHPSGLCRGCQKRAGVA